MFNLNNRHIRSNLTGASFRAAPSTDGGGSCPAFLNAGINLDFAVVGWVKPTWGSNSQYSIFGMNKHSVLKSSSNNTLEVRIAAADGTLGTSGASQATQALGISSVAALVLNEWNLVGYSWNNTTKVVTVIVFNSANTSGNAVASAAYNGATPPLAAGDCPNDMRIGSGGGFADWIGMIGCIAAINRQATLSDLQAIWNQKYYDAPLQYFIDTYSITSYWAAGLSIVSQLLNEAGGSLSQWMVPGESIGAVSATVDHNPQIDSGRTQGTNRFTHRPNWVNSVTGTGTYDSHDAETFFSVRPIVGAAAVSGVAGRHNALRNLGNSVAENDATIVVSNSRAVRRPAAGGQTVPERHSEGYIQARKSIVKGVLNGRPWNSSTEAIKNFGMNFSAAATLENTGTLKLLQSDTGWMDFSRCWTGGDNNGAGVASGQGIALTTSASAYGTKFTPESGSLFLSSNPLHVRYHLLKFPGHCGSFTWRPTRSANQAAGVFDAAATTVTGMDTQRTKRTYATGSGDSYNAGTKTLVIGADLSASGVVAGDIVVNGSNVSAAEISSISVANGSTTLVLKDALAASPVNGNVLYFGPWSTYTLEYDFPAVGDSNVNRGLLIGAPTIPANTLGPVLLAHDYWCTGVTGHVIGHAGYSGNGYANHIADSWTGALQNFYQKMFPALDTGFKSFNLIMHHADQQVASPGLFSYDTLVSTAVPGINIAYAGECVHAVESDMTAWDTVVLAQTNRLALSVTSSALLGNLNEQIARGYRADSAHLSAAGHLKVATANLTLAATLATPGARGGMSPLRISPALQYALANALETGDLESLVR